MIVTYTNSLPGTVVDCFPLSASLANWSSLKVRLVEGTGANVGRWTGDLSAGNWAVFESGDTPANFSESIGTLFVDESVAVSAETTSELVAQIDADYPIVRNLLDETGDAFDIPASYFVLCDANLKQVAVITPTIVGGRYSLTIPREHTTKQRTLHWSLRSTSNANTIYDSGTIRFDYAATEA